MKRDADTTRNDDAAIEQLVREVAEGWTMPPVRLDAPSWRDRVRGSRTRRIAAAGGWVRRVGQAATAAIALTVAGALVAVIITRPPPEPGKSPGASGTPGPTERVQATTLPKVLVTGDDPSPSVLVMRNERGDFSRVDLVTGSVNRPLTGKSSFSELRLESGGAVTCLCVEESGSIGTQPTDMFVTLERYDGRGKLVSTKPIDSFSGEPDPRDESVSIPEHPAHVLTEIGYSADGRYGFVGFSFRAHPVWKSGILVVDLADGSIAQRFELPDATDGEDDTRAVVFAPKVVGPIGDGEVLIARGSYQWSPPSSHEAMYTFDTDVFTASFAGSFSNLAPLQNTSDCGSTVNRAGALPGGGLWMACTNGTSQQTVVRRLDGGGKLLPDVRMSGGPGIETDPTALSADGSALFVWDPDGAILTKVSLATGEKSSGKGIAAITRPGPLAAFGNWLAPTAAAKSWLRGALVISPDGSRVYAIGVKAGVGESETGGSSGVFAFDSTTLEPIAIWQPTADFISVAVSSDGRFVYASGLPGVDAAGRSKIRQQASITVFDTSDGSVRLIAGQLGGDALMFVAPVLE